jgi:bacterioferritin
MQAKEGVLDLLNTVLTNELTAINQYFLQAKMCEHWGYGRLASKLRELAMGEMKDAEEVMDHILYLEGIPNLQRLGRVQVGESGLENLQLDLQIERTQIESLVQGISHCAQVGDFGTRGMLESMLRGEEEDVDWIETELETIKQIGLELYLSQQIH